MADNKAHNSDSSDDAPELPEDEKSIAETQPSPSLVKDEKKEGSPDASASSESSVQTEVASELSDAKPAAALPAESLLKEPTSTADYADSKVSPRISRSADSDTKQPKEENESSDESTKTLSAEDRSDATCAGEAIEELPRDASDPVSIPRPPADSSSAPAATDPEDSQKAAPFYVHESYSGESPPKSTMFVPPGRVGANTEDANPESSACGEVRRMSQEQFEKYDVEVAKMSPEGGAEGGAEALQTTTQLELSLYNVCENFQDMLNSYEMKNLSPNEKMKVVSTRQLLVETKERYASKVYPGMSKQKEETKRERRGSRSSVPVGSLAHMESLDAVFKMFKEEPRRRLLLEVQREINAPCLVNYINGFRIIFYEHRAELSRELNTLKQKLETLGELENVSAYMTLSSQTVYEGDKSPGELNSDIRGYLFEGATYLDRFMEVAMDMQNIIVKIPELDKKLRKSLASAFRAKIPDLFYPVASTSADSKQGL